MKQSIVKKHGSQPGNQKASKGGAYGALRRISKGQEFVSVALETQKAVEAETGIDPETLDGLGRIRFYRFVRMEATAQLFEAMALSSAAEGDQQTFAARKRWALYAGDKASREQDKLEAVVQRGDMVLLDAIKAADEDT